MLISLEMSRAHAWHACRRSITTAREEQPRLSTEQLLRRARGALYNVEHFINGRVACPRVIRHPNGHRDKWDVGAETGDDKAEASVLHTVTPAIDKLQMFNNLDRILKSPESHWTDSLHAFLWSRFV
eukprot:COSAG05_NODE_194_length_14555_cov_25.382955_8_plen_127_part_00